MMPYYQDASTTLYLGNCRDILPTLDAGSIDAAITDPPYELTANKPALNLNSPAGRSRVGTGGGGFMGMEWDATGISFDPELWAEVLRVLKPGGHLLAFGGSRTFHRIGVAIEDAGFEIRDSLSWLYGSGFPKSLNLGDGRGTALKPGWEPIIMARKPLAGTVAANVGRFGTGALNIEACRIGDDDTRRIKAGGAGQFPHEDDAWQPKTVEVGSASGRWPANVVLDEVAADLLDAQTGVLVSGANPTRRQSDKFRNAYGKFAGQTECTPARGLDMGGASRFYYVAKPSREERDRGCEGLPARTGGEATEREDDSAGTRSPRAGAGRTGGARNYHPTVKPIALMRWLVRLVTPVDGVVLDPFFGSGTTGIGAVLEGRRVVGIEGKAEYADIARRRVTVAAPLFTFE